MAAAVSVLDLASQHTRECLLAQKPSRWRKAPGALRNFRESQELISVGAAVHPADAKAAEAYARMRGVPTRFDSQGQPHFLNFRHQRRYLAKCRGMFNKQDIA